MAPPEAGDRSILLNDDIDAVVAELLEGRCWAVDARRKAELLEQRAHARGSIVGEPGLF